MTDDSWPKIRRADLLMTVTIRVGRNGKYSICEKDGEAADLGNDRD